MRAVSVATIPLGIALAWTAAPLGAQTPALADRQSEALRAAVGAAVAPTEVPPGWRPDRVEMAVDADGASDYRIVYRGPDGACFEVVGGPMDGLGGPVPAHQRGVVIEALPPGEGVRLYWSVGSDPGGPFPEPVVFTDWIPFGELAHRFASPSGPLGTCPAVDPETAAEIVASIAPIGSPGGARDDLREGDWQWLSYNDPTIEAPAGEAPVATARRLLDELGMGLSAEERGGELAVDETVEVERRDGSAAVRITREGGGDDSVAGVRYLVLLEEVGNGLLEFRIGRAFRCRSGRGHQGWSPELCL